MSQILKEISMRTFLFAVFVVANVACSGDGESAASDLEREAARPPETKSGGGRKAVLEAVKSVAPETLDVMAEDNEKTPSGVATRLIQAGTGVRHPSNDDAVVLYSQIYDSSGGVTSRGQELIGDPATDLNKHGQEAIHMMVEGEIRRFWFPDPALSGAIKVTDYELVWISPPPNELTKARDTSTR